MRPVLGVKDQRTEVSFRHNMDILCPIKSKRLWWWDAYVYRGLGTFPCKGMPWAGCWTVGIYTETLCHPMEMGLWRCVIPHGLSDALIQGYYRRPGFALGKCCKICRLFWNYLFYPVVGLALDTLDFWEDRQSGKEVPVSPHWVVPQYPKEHVCY